MSNELNDDIIINNIILVSSDKYEYVAFPIIMIRTQNKVFSFLQVFFSHFFDLNANDDN